MTIPAQIKTLQEERMLQILLLLLPLLLSLSIQIFNRKFNKIEPFITLPKYIGYLKKNHSRKYEEEKKTIRKAGRPH